MTKLNNSRLSLAEDKMPKVSNEGLVQKYSVVPRAKRPILLYSFLKRYANKKIMVFFSSSLSVKFHKELFGYANIDCLDILEDQNQEIRASTFSDFAKAEKGILLCTDVAVRGLQLSSLDWIIQYDPPNDLSEYIHRIGQTASEEEGNVNALLVLSPEELLFIKFLKGKKIAAQELEYNDKKMGKVQSLLENFVACNFHLNKSAKDGYRTFVRAYDAHTMKDVFNVHQLDLKAVAASFCFSTPPRVELKSETKGSKQRRERNKARADKPYGRDKRTVK